jgi:hypothetical protein
MKWSIQFYVLLYNLKYEIFEWEEIDHNINVED